jgi:hypothetical protein
MEAKLGFRGRWTLSKKNRLEKFIAQEEVRDVNGATLPPDDPWNAVLSRLSKPVRKVASGGVPAFGTRTRWTNQLISELLELAPEADVRSLMAFWLRNRNHTSEDILADPTAVALETDSLVTGFYAGGGGGVPSRIWPAVERHVRAVYRLAQSPEGRAGLRRVQDEPPPFTLDQLLDTAFWLLKQFFRRKRNTLRVHHRAFGRFVGINAASYAEVLLTHLETTMPRGWLAFVPEFDENGNPVPAMVSRRSRSYHLLGRAWPARPHETRLYLRPALAIAESA